MRWLVRGCEVRLAARHGVPAARSKTRVQSYRLFERSRCRYTFADDVERSAVSGRREDCPETRRHCDAAVEALELGSDLSLIVIHGQHAIELAAKSLQENGIRWKGSF